jgi:uncharacterized protein (DUF433 family)
MRWQDHIEQNRKIMVGKPVIKGTRITVELILERLGNGATHQDIFDAFPHVKTEHILAAQKYAAAVIAMDETIFSASA